MNIKNKIKVNNIRIIGILIIIIFVGTILGVSKISLTMNKNKDNKSSLNKERISNIEKKEKDNIDIVKNNKEINNNGTKIKNDTITKKVKDENIDNEHIEIQNLDINEMINSIDKTKYDKYILKYRTLLVNKIKKMKKEELNKKEEDIKLLLSNIDFLAKEKEKINNQYKLKKISKQEALKQIKYIKDKLKNLEKDIKDI